MNDLKMLEHLAPIADEMLAGLQAGEGMKRRIVQAAGVQAAPKRSARAFVPAICCASLAVACVSIIGLRLGNMGSLGDRASVGSEPGTVAIGAIAAGDTSAQEPVSVAELGNGVSVRAVAPQGESLFASGAGDMPLLTVDGAVYRMLATPQDVGSALIGETVGQVAAHVQEPSLASREEMQAGLSNIAQAGTDIYAVADMASTTLVAADVDGKTRLFQRVSYAGDGPGSQTLEDTFSVRGKAKLLELSGVGTLEGETANAVIDVLLDNATLKSADATARRQTLTVTLESGIKLQLGVSGDTLCGCGGWSCPEFFEAFDAALEGA